MRKYNRRKKNNIFLLVLLILGISVGFAFLSTTLKINGIAGINKNTWDIHWNENSIVETQGSVTATTPANVSDTEKKNVTFDIELELPGDFYEFTLDAKNYGTINGEIDNFDITIYQADGVTPYDGSTPARTLPSYIKYSFKYADGSPVEDGDVLEAGQSKKYRFRIEYDPEATELPDEPQTIKPVITIPELQTREEDNKPYTITFNPNGGEVSPTTKRVERGTAIGELPTPTRENYPFLGWYTGLTDGEKITAATIPDASTTYYAHWATSYTTLDTGKNVNTKMKTLAGNSFATDTPWNEVNTNIAAFVRSNSAPAQGTTTQIISVDGQTPVYAWFDNGVIRYYTEAEYIYLNADSSNMFNSMRYIDDINLTGFVSSNLTNTSTMFNGASALTLLNISTLDTSNVIDMSGMFAGCSSMSSLDLRNLDVSSVTSMSGMFAGSSNLNSINVSTWNTNSLTNIGGMFSGCSSLTTLDLSSFNTSNVNNMGGTFSGCSNLRTLKLNNWNFTNFDVSSLMMVLTGGGFNSLQTFELNNTVFGSNLNYAFGGLGTVQTFSLENADVSRATNMSSMFNGDRSVITLDLTSFDTSNVSNMSYMFYGMTNLTTITVSDDFVVNQVSSSDGMFSGDTNLVGGRGTVYDANHIDKEYARYDKGVSRPGYFNKANVTTYTVTFNPNGGTVDPSSKQVFEDESIGTLPTPTRNGYGFAGWYTLPQDGSLIDERTIIDSDVTYYAHWISNKTITYDGNGGTFNNSETQNTITYSYSGLQKTVYSHTSNIDDNGNANGQYESNLTTNDIVTIPGASGLNIEVWYSTENYYDWLAIYPEGVTPDRYNYSEATISNGQLMGGNSNSKPSDDSEYHKTFTVEGDTAQFFFRSDSGTNYYGYYAIITSINKEYTGDSEYKEPTKENYKFVGWNTRADGTGTTYGDEDRVIGDINNIPSTLYAKYRLLENYTITYDANGGTPTPSSVTVQEDHQIGELPQVSRTNYNFAGWWTGLTDGTEVTSSYIPTTSQTLWAHWDRIEYNITLDANGGDVFPQSVTVYAGDAITTLPTPTRYGYEFEGWWTAAEEGTRITASTVPTQNTTYYAHWEELPKNTISFDSNGGTPVEDMEVYEGYEIGVLPVSKKNKSALVSWYEEPELITKVRMTTIPDEDTTYYAKWQDVTTCTGNNDVTIIHDERCMNNLDIEPVAGILCKRAETLHQEECTVNAQGLYCRGGGYVETPDYWSSPTDYHSSGSKGTTTITYGKCGSSGTLSTGDAFTCDVNGDGIFNEYSERFYYLSDYYNTSTKRFDTTSAALVYYSNVQEGVACNKSSYDYSSLQDIQDVDSSVTSADNWHGPLTAKEHMPSWSNINLIQDTRAILAENGSDHNKTTIYNGGTLPTAFDYSGHSARLIAGKELMNACSMTQLGSPHDGDLEACRFLMENTQYSSRSTSNIGYYLETPHYSGSPMVWTVNSERRFVDYDNVYGSYVGTRPVIEVPKSRMQY